jgi:predicted aldo/keto reductase-like oxidoreductase
MEYPRMGRSGLKVSEICLGTMTFGHGTDATEAERIVQTSLDAGVNFFEAALPKYNVLSLPLSLDQHRQCGEDIILG